MLLLLSYCSVFKVQNCYAILPTKLRFVCANSAAHKNFRPFIAYAKFYFIKFCKQVARFLLVGLRGLEPPTSRLSGVRSNHLSYKPMLVLATVVVSSSSDALWWRWGGSNSWPPACKAGALPAELHPQIIQGHQNLNLLFSTFEGTQSFDCTL